MSVAPESALETLAAGSFLRVVNFHLTPGRRAKEYERQLAGYARRFAPVTVEDLDRLAETGRWPLDRPGIIPVFYEGYRNHVETALPLLERLGLVGWFFVPTDFVRTPVDEQRGFARQHHLGLLSKARSTDPIAMTESDLADLARRHVVAAHTATHEAIEAMSTDAHIEREIIEPKRYLEAVTGRPVTVFASLLGRPFGTSERCDVALREAGYRWVFSNTKIQRI